MTREELVKALRWLQVNTESLACLGCGHERRCSIHGCAVIMEAAQEISSLAAENAALQDQIESLLVQLKEARREAMTPQEAVDILRSANMGGVLRTAADVGIAALEKQIGGNYGKID